MNELPRDERGVSTVTYVLLLPIFILLTFGALQIWRIISIKQSLHLGTYQTARCISMHDSRDTTLAGCESLLHTTLASNNLIDDTTAYAVRKTYYNEDGTVIPDPTLRAYVRCSERFSMETKLVLPWNVIIPYLPAREMTLRERKSSYTECTLGPWAPPSEGTPITPLN